MLLTVSPSVVKRLTQEILAVTGLVAQYPGPPPHPKSIRLARRSTGNHHPRLRLALNSLMW